MNYISDWVRDLFSLTVSLRFSVFTNRRQDNTNYIRTEITVLHNTLILLLENRPISQSEDARRMQDRSAIRGHTGFAVVAVAMERQTWFTFTQKWCSAGANGTPPVTHILVSALGAGCCTGNGFTIFKLLVQKFQLSHSCVRTHNSQIGRTGRKSEQQIILSSCGSSALEVYQISSGLGIRFWKWTTENTQWALLSPHCSYGLIPVGTGWVLAALRTLFLMHISKNAYFQCEQEGRVHLVWSPLNRGLKSFCFLFQ